MKKKTVLVTGGAGFLGSHLCEKLLQLGNAVICLDNFYTGSKENIKHLAVNSDFEVIRHDIRMPITLEVDEIYNLACPASPVHYQKFPIEVIEASAIGMMHMLGLAKRLNIKILQASTSEVYGDPKIHPQTEGYWGNVNPIGPRACYDEGKRCAETLCFDYRRQHNVKIKIVRIFNTYGPRMLPDDGRVMSNFIVQALKGEDITVFGKGEQTRSFCYFDDMVDGFIRMMATEDDITGPVNLGNPAEISVLELANRVLSKVPSKSKIIFKPLPVDDPSRRQPDIALAKKLLNWQPKTSLDDGMEKTIEYFKRSRL